MIYKVKLDSFEGPFDLLVYLIENAQMSIYDIKVSEITAQYLGYLEEMKRMDVAVTAEFMVLAAELIAIKSKMLLPRTNTDDQDQYAEDPRSELVEKILEYKRFKKAAEILAAAEEENFRIYEKPQEDISEYLNDPDEILSLDVKQFVNAFNLFISKKQRIAAVKRTYERVERERITMEQKIGFIRGLFGRLGKKTVSFREALNSESDKYDVIVTFASILEMAKNKTVSLRQKVRYGDIFITDRSGAAGVTDNAGGAGGEELLQ